VSLLFLLLAFAALGFLIVVHEGGHYFVARWCGMRIDRFSIGFGPGIFKRVSKKTGTTFQIAPIPFGGFVEIRGMNIAEEVDPDDQFAYPNRPAWQRFITIFAGPATNYISAILVAFLLFTLHGIASDYRFFGVAAVQPSYGAAGKLEVGDRILAVDHKPIIAEGKYVAPDGTRYAADDRDTLRGRVNVDREVTITVMRDGQKRDVTISPRFARDPLGVLQTEDVPFVGCNHMTEETIGAIERFIPRKVFDCTPSYDYVNARNEHVQRHLQCRGGLVEGVDVQAVQPLVTHQPAGQQHVGHDRHKADPSRPPDGRNGGP